MKLKKLSSTTKRAPKWLYQRDDGRFVVYEQNKLFEATGPARREAHLPATVKKLDDAITAGERIRHEWMGKRAKPKSLVTVDEAVIELINLKTVNWSKGTLVDANLIFNKHILPWFRVHCPNIAFFNADACTRYLTYVKESNPTRKRKNERKHLVMLGNFAFERGYIDRPVKIQKKGLDPDEEAGRVISDEEITSLLGEVKRTDTRLQIMMAYETGMRRGEALGLQWSWINWSEKFVVIPKHVTKTRRDRIVPLSDRLLAALRIFQFETRARNSPYLYPNPNNPLRPIRDNKTAWQGLKTRTGIECRWHDFRVTAITRMIRSGIDSLKVSRYCGVSPDVIAEHYLKLRVDDLRVIAETCAGKVRVA